MGKFAKPLQASTAPPRVSLRSMSLLINVHESRLFWAVALIASWRLCFCQALPAQQSGVLKELVFEEVARDLLRPAGITHAGDGSGRLFINLQDGSIRIHDGTRLLEKPLLTEHWPKR